MTRNEIDALFHRREALFNQHDAAGLAQLYALDAQVESPLAAGTVRGRQALTKIHQALFDAFPDVSWERQHLIVDGELVAQIGQFGGSYTGGFMGLPPNGRPFSIPVAIVCRIGDGEILYERRVYDLTGVLVQIGVLKATSA
ncbi:MAG: ester cyclase [Vicinamibacterales bacterium]